MNHHKMMLIILMMLMIRDTDYDAETVNLDEIQEETKREIRDAVQIS